MLVVDGFFKRDLRLFLEEFIYSLFELIFSHKYFLIKKYKCLEELIKITYSPISPF